MECCVDEKGWAVVRRQLTDLPRGVSVVSELAQLKEMEKQLNLCLLFPQNNNSDASYNKPC